MSSTFLSPLVQLPSNVRAQIESTVEIRSITDVVEGLVKNSLDANAKNINIQVHFQKGYCSVRDDGHGIQRAEFDEGGHLGQMHCTSNSDCLDNLYGQYGRFLACLSAVSLLSIRSRYQQENGWNRLILHNTNTLSRQIAVDDREYGSAYTTEILVNNLFNNYPVRFNQNAKRFLSKKEVIKAFEDLRKKLVGIILAYPNDFTFRLTVLDLDLDLLFRYRPEKCDDSFEEIDLGRKLDLKRIVSIFQQSKLVPSNDINAWRVLSAKSSKLVIDAAIFLIPAPTRSAQFISFHHVPLKQKSSSGVLYDLVNDSFTDSSFATTVESQTDDISVVDRWPVFYIRIDQMSTGIKIGTPVLRNSAYLPSGLLDQIKTLLSEMLHKFLAVCGFTKFKHKNRQIHKRSIDSSDRYPATCYSQGIVFPAVESAKFLSNQDLSAGLPFLEPISTTMDRTKGEHFTIADTSTNEAGLEHVCDHDRKPLHISPSEQALETISLPTEMDDDEPLVWTNPRSGMVLRFNPTTGTQLHSYDFPGRNPSSQNHNEPEKVIQRTKPTMTIVARNASRQEYVSSLSQSRKCVTFGVAERPIANVINFTNTIEAGSKSDAEKQLTQACERISKSQLAKAEIVGQVDTKFIFAILRKFPYGHSGPDSPIKGVMTGDLLLVIDQHAADERVKVEMLYETLCFHEERVLHKPLTFEISNHDANCFDLYAEFFQSWGIHFRIERSDTNQVDSRNALLIITVLPEVVAERCRLNPKILIDLIRKEVWSEVQHACMNDTLKLGGTKSGLSSISWVDRLRGCPKGLLNLLNSRACRSAIMFNDVLEIDGCVQLVQNLSETVFPFQCAHGRPTMTCISNLDIIETTLSMVNGYKAERLEKQTFRTAWDSWTGCRIELETPGPGTDERTSQSEQQ